MSETKLLTRGIGALILLFIGMSNLDSLLTQTRVKPVSTRAAIAACELIAAVAALASGGALFFLVPPVWYFWYLRHKDFNLLIRSIEASTQKVSSVGTVA